MFDHRELDQWIILANHREQAYNWIRENFMILDIRHQARTLLVSPHFNRHDIFYLKTVVSERELKGHKYYEFIDIRDPLYVDHTYPGESPIRLSILAAHCMRLRNLYHMHQSPDEGDQS